MHELILSCVDNNNCNQADKYNRRCVRIILIWRRVRDSNPGDLSVYSISSAMLSDRFSGIFCQKQSDMDRRKSARRLDFSAVAFKKSPCFGVFPKWVQITKNCDFGQNWGQTGQNKGRTAIHGQHTDNSVILRCIANERERSQLGFHPGDHHKGSALSDLPHQQIHGAVPAEKR